MTESGESKLPLQYEDGPDFCTVRDAQGRDFALTMQPDLMKAMEKALSDEIASFMRAPVKCSSAGNETAKGRVRHIVRNLASVNMTAEAAERQARRITDELEAAGLIASEPQTLWQPIETAPKDGSKVDLWITPPKGMITGDGSGRACDCWFSDGKWWLYDETKYASDSANCRSEVWHVTHWMPRPGGPLSRPQHSSQNEGN